MFIDDIIQEDYIKALKMKPAQVAHVEGHSSLQIHKKVETIQRLANEVAVQEFKLMFKKVSAELGHQFDQYLEKKKGINYDHT